MVGVRITVLAGGTGGSRFVRGLLHPLSGSHEVTVIGNTGDDAWLFGLRVCPDLDTVMYTLGGGIHEGQGWGRTEETFVVKEELAAYKAEPQWFGLGDRDFATHILRSQLLHAGATLSEATAALCARWQPGVTLLPMSDDLVETHVLIERDGRQVAVHFQEWWVKLHASVPAKGFVLVGAENARPAPGVAEAIEDADVVLFPPSNPVVSVGMILSVPGIREALEHTRAPVVGLSPIIGGAPIRGMADACLTALGIDTTAEAVGRFYGPDLLDGWLVDEQDAGAVVPGVAVRAVPLYMTDVESTARMAVAALDLAAELRARG